MFILFFIFLGDVSFETTIVITSDVTVAMTEDWSTKTVCVCVYLDDQFLDIYAGPYP